MDVIGVRIDRVDYGSASRQVAKWAGETLRSRMVCAANVHVLMEAHDSQVFRSMLKQADLVTPDGMPLVWVMCGKGAHDQRRVYGPTLMLHVLDAAVHGKFPVGFYGGTPEVSRLLEAKMRERFPGLQVAFNYSPPFVEFTPAQDAEIVDRINKSQAAILFVGLGCPKQEIWMAKHKGRIQAVMLGVGAAFDFHAGVKRQAPAWIQKVGLEWLFRLFNEPGRLWKRYLYHNPRFLVLAISDLLGLLEESD
jgi:N-acetylglucosaminyldiphosphoundecaprenol N-acetyl-beta-D-mannosaminyltransferase